MSDDEDEGSKPTDEGLNSMKKVKKKGRSSKCTYCSKGFHSKNKCFKKNMDIMSQFLENHNIDVPDELEKPVESSEHCHSEKSQVNINYALSERVKYLPWINISVFLG